MNHWTTWMTLVSCFLFLLVVLWAKRKMWNRYKTCSLKSLNSWDWEGKILPFWINSFHCFNWTSLYCMQVLVYIEWKSSLLETLQDYKKSLGSRDALHLPALCRSILWVADDIFTRLSVWYVYISFIFSLFLIVKEEKRNRT